MVGIIIFSTTVFAQDTHFWNLQYGTRSTLLGGTVIGSISDLAATYYNPAAPALFPKPENLLSGVLFSVGRSEITLGALGIRKLEEILEDAEMNYMRIKLNSKIIDLEPI